MIAGLQLFRPAGRHRQESYSDVAASLHITYYLTPMLIYDTLPVAVLLAVLVTFGVMTKNNEVTAFKACGISVRRLGLPVLLMSGVLSARLFASDYSWIPQANQIQDAIRNEIKGRPVQTYLHPERKWVIHDYRIFYFQVLRPLGKGDGGTLRLRTRPENVPANARRSTPTARAGNRTFKQWVWEQGTRAIVCGVVECKVQNFTATSFPEITETPGRLPERSEAEPADELRRARRVHRKICSRAVSTPSSCTFSTTRNSPCRCSR